MFGFGLVLFMKLFGNETRDGKTGYGDPKKQAGTNLVALVSHAFWFFLFSLLGRMETRDFLFHLKKKQFHTMPKRYCVSFCRGSNVSMQEVESDTRDPLFFFPESSRTPFWTPLIAALVINICNS